MGELKKTEFKTQIYILTNQSLKVISILKVNINI